MGKFWYVYQRFGGAPYYKHLSYTSAVTEAQRLIDTVGGEYEILEGLAIVKAAPRYVVETLYEQATTPTRFDRDNVSF